MAHWIVCGVAGERTDCATLKVAAELADQLGARLAIVTVIGGSVDGTDKREVLSEGRAAVAGLARRCSVVDDAVHRVELGDPVDELTRVAEELDAQMLVVGGSHRSALTSLVRAGIAPRLSRRAGRPVAVVPPASGPDEDAVRVLLAAADGGVSGQVEPLAAVRRRFADRMSGRDRGPVVFAGQR